MNFLKRQSGSCVSGGTEISQITLKYLNLCPEDKQKSYGFGTIQGGE